MSQTPEVSLEDVLVDVSHDIEAAMLGDAEGRNWTPVSADDSPTDAYQHGVADGVRWLLGALMVGVEDPNKVPLTDEHLEMLAGVMYLFGERGVMRASLTLGPA